MLIVMDQMKIMVMKIMVIVDQMKTESWLQFETFKCEWEENCA